MATQTFMGTTAGLGKVVVPKAGISSAAIPSFAGFRSVRASIGSKVQGKKAMRRSLIVRAEADDTEGLSPLEILRRENELLRQTISTATESLETIEGAPAQVVTEEPPAAAPAAAAAAPAAAAAAPAAAAPAGPPPKPGYEGPDCQLPYPSTWKIGGEDGMSLSDLPYHLKIPGVDWSPILKVPEDHEYVEVLGEMSQSPEHDGTECLKWDDSLWSHSGHFQHRWGVYNSIKDAINQNEGGMEKFSAAYKNYGLNRVTLDDGRRGVMYREYAPAARSLGLVGEFNNWNPEGSHWATKNEFGTWELFLEDKADGTAQVPHKSKVKARVEDCNGEWNDRIPAYIRWATQEPNEIPFNANMWDPPKGKHPKPGVLDDDYVYTFKYPRPEKPRALRIYECHVGMSSIDPKVNSYNEFRTQILPRIRNLGYNALQIMAIQEHAYYGSFGYHVTNFFGVSSRCGTPEELKALIDEAHRLGLVVLMDIVHSHASNNTIDGINNFDGSDYLFHHGARGYHWMWDSRLFNYGHWETMRYLLSNARYWLDEYKFDGFRFDGVTSMMYHHHGLQMAFTGNYEEYFGMATDVDAVVYLMLANDMMHSLFPSCITIGEDVSGMPTFCRPVSEGGVGFDYRLQMAIADKWIDMMAIPDDSWGMWDLTHCLSNRRYMEACVGYAESHDQALVGDKTIAFWLMDADMYDYMAAPGFGPSSPTVDRGIALHKMVRLVTMVLGGESYLNFMGNEFGHPEWIDFPRVDSFDPSTGKLVEGNGGSHEKCRRRFDLADADYLKYNYLNSFDRAMNHLDKAFGFIGAPHTYISRKDDGDKMIVVEQGDLVFVFNFHPNQSYNDYRIGCLNPGAYKLVLSSDEKCFGGWENASKYADAEFFTDGVSHDDRPHSFMAYSPSRTVTVYAPSEFVDSTAEEVPGLAVKGNGPYWAM